MSDAVVSASPPIAVSAEGPGLAQLRARAAAFTAQPAVRRALPALGAVAVVAVIAALYLTIASGPQRVLYGNLSDSERAQVVETLEGGGIAYTIDNSTGALTVAEDDIYRARMLVASNAGLAAPQGASEMLDAIPLGSSRTLEGERLRLARERELTLTIREIDGIEAARVHLATPERSVFVRENNPPTASVMVRLANGRTLAQSQVEAIVNLVSGSVPGMASDAVRVVDQNGQLLSSPRDERQDGLALQRGFEAKLQEQIAVLLLPLLGDGNFSSQVQVELDQTEVTAARETYDREGALRNESERLSNRSTAMAGGVPGVTANTPPPAQLVDEAPDPAAAQDAAANPTDSESARTRQYELDREVAVTSQRPGGLVKVSVAIAVGQRALAAAAPLTQQQLQQLVGAAVGADEARGDRVEIVVGAFGAAEFEPVPFYEAGWFAQVLRYGTALIAVLLVLLLGVKPLLARLRAPGSTEPVRIAASASSEPELAREKLEAVAADPHSAQFPEKVELARQFVASQPDRAVEALQRMLAAPGDGSTAGQQGVVPS